MMLTTAFLLLVGQAGQPAAQPKPVEPRKVCRREVSTSSRLNVKRICRTSAEWDAIEGIERENVRRQTEFGRAGSAG